MQNLELKPIEYAQLRHHTPHVLLDVRQPWEVAKARIENSHHIPMTELLEHIEDLPKDKKIIVYCHHGIRSLNVCVFLREQGFKDVYSLAGGIEAWSHEIDPTVKIY